jgi:nucleoside-diphosphate-sugar epimerase
MKVLITGGAGFLGQRLLSALLKRPSLFGKHQQPEPIDQITVLDLLAPPTTCGDSRVRFVEGDITAAACISSVLDESISSVFHLAAVVSGAAEADFDLGMRINLDATRLVLERCRNLGHVPRVVMTSSVASFSSSQLGIAITEDTAPTPMSSYGTQKVMAELLVNDYSRKGFIDGRTLRVPTVSVRPGKPNAAASSFASGIIREPLAGVEAVCPVPPDTSMWLMSPRLAIDNLIYGHELAENLLGFPRTITLPGLSVTAGEMVAALRQVAGADVANLVRWTPNEMIKRIVLSWPGTIATPRAVKLGFQADTDFTSMIRDYRDGLAVSAESCT